MKKTRAQLVKRIAELAGQVGLQEMQLNRHQEYRGQLQRELDESRRVRAVLAEKVGNLESRIVTLACLLARQADKAQWRLGIINDLQSQIHRGAASMVDETAATKEPR